MVCYYKRCISESVAASVDKQKKKIYVHANEEHELFNPIGHKDKIRTTTALRIELKWERMHKYESCAKGKGKRMSISHISDFSNKTKATVPGGRNFLLDLF